MTSAASSDRPSPRRWLVRWAVRWAPLPSGRASRSSAWGATAVGRAALIEGIASTGTDVKDIGMTPTPVLYFATTHFKNGSGVAVTGSHNPPEYNGLKMMLGGMTLFGSGFGNYSQGIRVRMRYSPKEKGNE